MTLNGTTFTGSLNYKAAHSYLIAAKRTKHGVALRLLQREHTSNTFWEKRQT